jgi:hypothetical protein
VESQGLKTKHRYDIYIGMKKKLPTIEEVQQARSVMARVKGSMGGQALKNWYHSLSEEEQKNHINKLVEARKAKAELKKQQVS